MTESLGYRAFTMVRGVIYTAGFVWLWTWLATVARTYDDRLPVTLPPWLRPIGFALAIVGGAIAASCIATFVFKGRGTPAPFDPPREFVATGLYRYVRNPMYVGAAAVILGSGLAVSSPSIVVLALGFLAITHLVVVLYEEPTLSREFCDSYRQYRATVHRWLIWPPGSAPPR